MTREEKNISRVHKWDTNKIEKLLDKNDLSGLISMAHKIGNRANLLSGEDQKREYKRAGRYIDAFMKERLV